MSTHLVLTVIAADKPGLVETLAQTIKAHAGNWLESRMARMAGQFAGILRVDIAEADVDALRRDLEALNSQGISVQLAISAAEAEREPDHLQLDLLGNDRPGLVLEVSQVLARHGVNVEALETERSPAPMSADLLFRAEALLAVGPKTDLDQLRRDLESLADDLMVDISLAGH